MPKKKEPDLTPEEQFKRFKEAAEEHGIEERLPEIEKAFDALAAHPRQPKKDNGSRKD
jgi:hypothetical protein